MTIPVASRCAVLRKTSGKLAANALQGSEQHERRRGRYKRAGISLSPQRNQAATSLPDLVVTCDGLPLLILICLGFASSRLGMAMVSRPLSKLAWTFS